jgi:hypothetical protein
MSEGRVLPIWQHPAFFDQDLTDGQSREAQPGERYGRDMCGAITSDHPVLAQ